MFDVAAIGAAVGALGAALAGPGRRVRAGSAQALERQGAQRVGGAQVAGHGGFAALGLDACGAKHRQGLL